MCECGLRCISLLTDKPLAADADRLVLDICLLSSRQSQGKEITAASVRPARKTKTACQKNTHRLIQFLDLQRGGRQDFPYVKAFLPTILSREIILPPNTTSEGPNWARAVEGQCHTS